MTHNHSHNANSHGNPSSSSNLKTAFFLNFIFTIIELIGGFLTNSIAIVADAFHDFGDSISLGFSWILENYSKKGRSKRFSYGYRRFSLLAAFINCIILIFGSIIILYYAIPRIISPEPVNYAGVFILAVIGVLVNGAAVLKLKKGSSINEKVVTWHLLEDVFGWVLILIVSLINFVKEIPILDPILAVLFTLIVLYNVLKNLRSITLIFLQGTPSGLNTDKIEEKISAIKGVKSIHDSHLWTLDNENHILTVHIVVGKKTSSLEMKNIKCSARKIISEFHIHHSTIEIEREKESCDYENC